METKEVKIECPEGFEIDKEKSTFEKIVFKKKQKVLPKSYSEFVFNNTRSIDKSKLMYSIKTRTFDEFYKDFVEGTTVENGIPQEYGKAFIALSKLIQLRDCYNDGWKPDWNDDAQIKYYILIIGDDIVRGSCWSCRNILSFKDEKTRDEFYSNFKSLIEKTKELI